MALDLRTITHTLIWFASNEAQRPNVLFKIFPFTICWFDDNIRHLREMLDKDVDI